MEPFYGIILAVVLSIIHFYSESVAKIAKQERRSFLSFSAGILITLIFIEMLPSVSSTQNINIFYLMLTGFTAFHLVEKHAYHHQVKRRNEEITDLHSYGFFLDHFIIGFFLILVITSSFSAGLIATIPFILITISSSISLETIHQQKNNILRRIFLASSTTMGAIVAIVLEVSLSTFYYLFSFVIGAVMYITIRDIIPTEGREKKAEYFVLGIIITILILYLTHPI